MGKRKGRQSQKTLNNDNNNNNNSNCNEDESLLFRSEDLEEEKSESDGEFFGCYLLTSLCPRYKGHTYIGFTVNPRRRIRQHNGELCSGAFRTKKKRPWEMVLCIYGFPTNVAALQFEWAWQHPVESLAVRKAAVGFKSLGGLANKIKLAYTMLTLPSWNTLKLTVNFFSTKYTIHYAGCPTLPSHMRVHIRSMDELPCYTEGYKDIEDDLFKFENNLLGDEEDTEKSGGSSDCEATVEDIPVSVSVDHHNIEEAATCVSDTENYKRPFCNDDLWDDEPEKSGGCCESQARFGDIMMSAPVSVDHHTNDKNAICVSDDANYELPSCTNKSPGRLFVDIPESSFTGSDYCSVTSPITENKNGKRDCATDKDGPRTKISAFSGPVEVIDVFTPSPEYKANSRRKKRAVSVVCPEIIDLTESPICV